MERSPMTFTDHHRNIKCQTSKREHRVINKILNVKIFNFFLYFRFKHLTLFNGKKKCQNEKLLMSIGYKKISIYILIIWMKIVESNEFFLPEEKMNSNFIIKKKIKHQSVKFIMEIYLKMNLTKKKSIIIKMAHLLL